MIRWKQVKALTFRDVIAETIMGKNGGDVLVESGQTITPSLRHTLIQKGVQWVCVLGDGAHQEETDIHPLVSPKNLDRFGEEVNEIYNDIILEGRVDKERAETLGKMITNEVVRNFGDVIIPSLYRLKEIDQYTFTHQVNVSIISTTLAMMVFPDDMDRIQKVSVAGLLHDVGKILVPQEILKNRERLSDMEFLIIRKHPDYGYEIAEQSGIDEPDILDPILYHHERWDGRGYNAALAGDSIPLTSRIIMLADVYDALTTERPYKKAWSTYQTVSYIIRESARIFDPDLVNAFLQTFGIYPAGTRVLLSTGEEGEVIGMRKGCISRPLVSVDGKNGWKNRDLDREKTIRILRVIHTVEPDRSISH